MIQDRYQNSLKNAKTFPGVIFSDHNLVLAEVDIQLKNVDRRKVGLGNKVLNTEKLKDEEIRKVFVEKFEEKYSNQKRIGVDSNVQWEYIKLCLLQAAEEAVGYHKHKTAKKPWVTEQMLQKMRERKTWKQVDTEDGRKIYRKLNNELRRETDRAKEEFDKRKYEDIEELERVGKYGTCNSLSRYKTIFLAKKKIIK